MKVINKCFVRLACFKILILVYSNEKKIKIKSLKIVFHYVKTNMYLITNLPLVMTAHMLPISK